ncbi:DUF4260 domain-containing protein [Actinosynnema pretiosum subsp. pretiosum]|uniref:DUF4260 domain-containing protein n=1 Tax=Actinosynnema pretiosum subsp. pretiosum TaxID=103721 RepID=A0AA45L6H9_9PSEU|nr:hypothetical protein APASM_4463 [Actinosynnema pretiosum subsp. pretiosum]QUF04182.1 DUF4260 domain-containing protein [Actinosynnema pretiosum subsp. pretiosum]
MSTTAIPESAAPAPATPPPGVVTGRPLAWLRAEGLAVAAAALVLFAGTGQPWWLVPALFLAPDLAALGYLAGPKIGAWCYNLAHTAPLPLALAAAGTWWDSAALTVAGAIGLLHLGVDRLAKYGVKYDHSFGATHLGLHGPDRP